MKKEIRKSLSRLLTSGIRDLYCAEKEIARVLPKMIRAATSPILKRAFQEHLDITHIHVNRLLEVFRWIGHKPKGKKCVPIRNIIREGKYARELAVNGSASRDLGLIFTAQKMECYEIAGYAILANVATELLLDNVADTLFRTHEEEVEAGTMYADIASNDIIHPAFHLN
ncbi:DUF892 family protein [Terrimonas sp. NA20]|uniref:DUF892 family protein n=1 Tax=Terrimonas ginsenosidimutans TaxID=2908004 RepID=A0ABS9KS57_9BACT|nr:DUF892 family protein [Terrimonas ginsenosidimutans]MCG2615146.1 DUF892 family protein [Terrimonas ginsenosidimutans]